MKLSQLINLKAQLADELKDVGVGSVGAIVIYFSTQDIINGILGFFLSVCSAIALTAVSFFVRKYLKRKFGD